MTDVAIVPELQLPIGKNRYSITRMSVFDQMTVASDFRDVLIGLALVKRDRPKEMSEEDYHRTIDFLMTVRGNITPDVRHQVMNLCLKHVTRQSGQGWAAILAAENIMQFDDIELPDISRLLHAVFEHNKLLDFFSASPSILGGQGTAKVGQV